MIELYEFAASGNCHKVRLLLSLLKLPYQSVPVNGAEKQHKSADFLAMNGFGQVPVLRDGDTVIRDSQAILVYLARQYGGEQWLPNDAAGLAEVCSWLSTAANEVSRGPNALRLHYKFGRQLVLADAEQISHNLLALLQLQLQQHPYRCGSVPNIADVALYPYLALAPEARLDLQPFPAVRDWLTRIQQLDGYVSMPGMWQA